MIDQSQAKQVEPTESLSSPPPIAVPRCLAPGEDSVLDLAVHPQRSLDDADAPGDPGRKGLVRVPRLERLHELRLGGIRDVLDAYPREGCCGVRQRRRERASALVSKVKAADVGVCGARHGRGAAVVVRDQTLRKDLKQRIRMGRDRVMISEPEARETFAALPQDDKYEG